MSGSPQGSYGCAGEPGLNLFGSGKPQISPYLDFATAHRPRSFADVIDWSEYVSQLSDDLWVGLNKLYGYFSTRIMIQDNATQVAPADVANCAKWDRLLNESLAYPMHEIQMGLNVGVYGNDFITVTMSQHRVVRCPECSWTIAVNQTRYHKDVKLQFNRDMSFTGYCQGRCKSKNHSNRRRRFAVIQYSKDQAKDIVTKHWPIRELEFDFLEARDKLRVYWRIPQRVKDSVLIHHDPDALHDLDWAVLEAIASDRLLEFDDRVMFHAKEPVLSGLLNRGLGIPRTLALSRQHWLVQMLKKQCQSLASAYVAPMEFFSLAQPNQTGFSADPMGSVNLSEFGDYIDTMLQQHKINPTRKFYVPYPVNYQVAGANADQFVPTTLMEMAARDLSNNLVPQAMLSGDLTVQTSPIFVRMFEATNRPIPFMYNAFLAFYANRVSELLKVEPVMARHSPVSVEDNLGIDAMLQEGAAAGKNSDGAWMDRLGLNPRWETARQLAEMQTDMDVQREVERMQTESGFADQVAMSATPEAAEQQEAAAGGGGAAGAMPAQPPVLPSQGFQPSNDLSVMETEAQMVANALLMMPDQNRQMELSLLRDQYETFHDLVTAAMEDMRRQGAMDARAQVFPTM